VHLEGVPALPPGPLGVHAPFSGLASEPSGATAAPLVPRSSVCSAPSCPSSLPCAAPFSTCSWSLSLSLPSVTPQLSSPGAPGAWGLRPEGPVGASGELPGTPQSSLQRPR